VVVVRRSRPLDAEAEASAPAAPDTDGIPARPARVFRVESAPAAGASLAPQPAPLPSPEAAAISLADARAGSRPPRQRRARRSQQAPGLATVISFAPPAVPVLPYREQMARLGELMRALDEALAVALQARSFELTLP
jgi:hypothetical protein